MLKQHVRININLQNDDKQRFMCFYLMWSYAANMADLTFFRFFSKEMHSDAAAE